MRHGKSFNHLKRKSAHRKAMLANMASSLIEHKQIVTTLAKAKALRQYVEPLATKAKTDNTHSRRTVFSYLRDKQATKELFGVIGPAILNRPGGYTRILKLGQRQGDSAEMALIEFVDFNDYGYTQNESEGGGRRRRRRRSKKKKGSEDTQQQPKEQQPQATAEAEVPPAAEEASTETPEQPEATEVTEATAPTEPAEPETAEATEAESTGESTGEAPQEPEAQAPEAEPTATDDEADSEPEAGTEETDDENKAG